MSPDLLLDTNVVVDIYSISDLDDALHACVAGGGDPRTEPKVGYRLARHRSAVALATWLSWKKRRTEALPSETLRILLARSPPSAVTTFKGVYTYYWVHFIRDYLLRRWQFSFKPGVDEFIRGTDCDDLLLKLAGEYGVPLITNEGVTPVGQVAPGKLHDRAKRLGLAVFTPAEFLATQGASLEQELECFYRLFKSKKNQDRFKRRFSKRRASTVRDVLAKLERDLALSLGL